MTVQVQKGEINGVLNVKYPFIPLGNIYDNFLLQLHVTWYLNANKRNNLF